MDLARRTVPRNSPNTAGAGVRAKTGVSVLAIERGDQKIANPTPDTEILANDVLVVVGTDDGHEALKDLLTAT